MKSICLDVWFVRPMLAGVALLAAGCGGGGGGSGSDAPPLKVTPTSLSFYATVQDALPPTLTLLFDHWAVPCFSGDQPSWLQVKSDVGGPGAEPRFYTVSALPNVAPPAIYKIVLHFARENCSVGQGGVDIPIEFVLTGFIVTPAAVFFNKIDGSSKPAVPQGTVILSILGQGDKWVASSDSAWAHLSKVEGTGPTRSTVSVDSAGLDLGHHMANLRFAEKDGTEVRIVTVTVNVLPPKLVLPPNPYAVTIDKTTKPSQLTKTLMFSDELDGQDTGRAVHWSVPVTPDGITVDPVSGSTSPPQEVHITYDPSKFPDGETTFRQLAVDARNFAGDTVRQNLDLPIRMNLPHVHNIAPYLGFSDRPASVTLRGTALDGTTAATAFCADRNAISVDVANDSDLRVVCPQMPAGIYPVYVSNLLGLIRSESSILIRDPMAPGAATLPSSGIKARLVFDDERGVLYAVNVTGQVLERFQFREGTWTALDPLMVPALADAALRANGKSLWYLSSEAVGVVKLDPAFDPTGMASPSASNDYRLAHIAFTNLNGFVISTAPRDDSSSSPTPTFVEGASEAHLIRAETYASPDGSIVLLPSSSRDWILYYASQFPGAGFVPHSMSNEPTTWSRDGSRLCTSTGTIMVRKYYEYPTYISAGSLDPAHLGTGVVISADGSRAYSYLPHPSGTDSKVSVFDLTLALDTAGHYPLIATIPIVGDPNPALPARQPPLLMSGDDRVLFIGGSRAVLVVPLR